MTVSLRAEITAEEYAQIRVAALSAGVSTQAFLGQLIRDGFEEHRSATSPPVSMGDAVKAQRAKNAIQAELLKHSTRKGALTEGEQPRRLDVPVVARGAQDEPGLAPPGLASPSVSVPDIPGVKRASEVEPPAKVLPTGELRGSGPAPKLYARAGCPKKVPMGERCEECKAVHQP